jgi:hypothetical protein
LFKLGIYRLDQYQGGGLRAALSKNRFSFTLLRTDLPATPKQIELFEEIMAQLRLSSGVYRTTFRGRFRDFNQFLNSRLTNRFHSAAPLRIEDWAASDCLTSSEWAASLFPLFPAATITASDLTLFLIEARLPDGSSYILEANGEPLQYISPPFVIRLSPPEPGLLAINTLLARRARARLKALRETWDIPREWVDSETPATFEQKPYTFKKIPVIHPEAQSLRRSSDRFLIRRHSVFERAEELSDVIRTMNIFNLAYFGKEQLLEGARAVGLSLQEGGIWIVGRTFQEKPPAHNGSIFVREKSGFRLLERFGEGSEIEELVLAGLTL